MGNYNANCKNKGKTLKQYLREKKTVVVLKTLVFECVWAPSLVQVVFSCKEHGIYEYIMRYVYKSLLLLCTDWLQYMTEKR